VVVDSDPDRPAFMKVLPSGWEDFMGRYEQMGFVKLKCPVPEFASTFTRASCTWNRSVPKCWMHPLRVRAAAFPTLGRAGSLPAEHAPQEGQFLRHIFIARHRLAHLAMQGCTIVLQQAGKGHAQGGDLHAERCGDDGGVFPAQAAAAQEHGCERGEEISLPALCVVFREPPERAVQQGVGPFALVEIDPACPAR